MKTIDWEQIRAMAIDCLSSSIDLLSWARRSQEKDYDADSATLHLAAIGKARDILERSFGILSMGSDGRSEDYLRQFPIYDQLALASKAESARPDFGVSSTAHEAAFRLLMIGLLHIEGNLKDGGLMLEDLHGISLKKLRVALRDVEKNDPIKNVLGGFARLNNLQAWIHREWANVSDVHPKKRNKPEKPQEQGVNPNGNTHRNGLELDGPLTENDRCIIQAMIDLGTTIDNPQSAVVILRSALAQRNNKHEFVRLKAYGIVESKVGRGGGYWLTDKGRALAVDMRKRCRNGATVSPTDCTD